MFGRRQPIVHLYSVCWNEARILPFFFRHYQPWVQRFVIYDNGSTDDTRALLAAKSNVEVRPFPWADPDSFVLSHQQLHNTCWRESRGKADWVVVTAIDEHLYHADILGYLRRCDRAGVTCVPALGYEMVTDAFPDPDAHLANVHTVGAPSAAMNKLRLFKPDLVEPNIMVGGHSAKSSGRVVCPERDEILLLHYKHLGYDYVADRNRLLVTGLRSTDRANNWAHHYNVDQSSLEARFAMLRQRSVDLRSPDHIPWRDHLSPRFWRQHQPAEKRGWRGLWTRLERSVTGKFRNWAARAGRLP